MLSTRAVQIVSMLHPIAVRWLAGRRRLRSTHEDIEVRELRVAHVSLFQSQWRFQRSTHLYGLLDRQWDPRLGGHVCDGGAPTSPGVSDGAAEGIEEREGRIKPDAERLKRAEGNEGVSGVGCGGERGDGCFWVKGAPT